ncbi:MAG: hypothetical protein AAFV86_10750, partial [Pseudomonadota bacterium]
MAEATLDAPRTAAADEANAEGLRRDAVAERMALFGLTSPALLLVLVILVVPNSAMRSATASRRRPSALASSAAAVRGASRV